MLIIQTGELVRTICLSFRSLSDNFLYIGASSNIVDTSALLVCSCDSIVAESSQPQNKTIIVHDIRITVYSTNEEKTSRDAECQISGDLSASLAPVN